MAVAAFRAKIAEAEQDVRRRVSKQAFTQLLSTPWDQLGISDLSDIASAPDGNLKAPADSSTFNGRVCKSPTYKRTKEDTASYFRQQLHADTEHLRLPLVVTSIDARCTFLFPKAGGKLMFLWQGFFFDLQRM